MSGIITMSISTRLILKKEDLMTLCNLAGIRSLDTFPLPDVSDLTKSSVIRSIYELSRKELVRYQGTRLELTEKGTDLMQPLAGGVCVAIEYFGEVYTQKLVYYAGRAVIMEEDHHTGDGLILESVTMEELQKKLQDVGGIKEIPKWITEELLKEKAVKEERQALMKSAGKYLQEEPEEKGLPMVMRIEKRNDEKVAIINGRDLSWIIAESAGEYHVLPYSGKLLCEEVHRINGRDER